MSRIISDILELHGVYTAALERDYVRSLQRPAPPKSPELEPRPRPVGRPAVVKVKLRPMLFELMSDGAWWSSRALHLALGLERRVLHQTIQDLLRVGILRRELANAGQGRLSASKVQRYRLAATHRPKGWMSSKEKLGEPARGHRVTSRERPAHPSEAA